MRSNLDSTGKMGGKSDGMVDMLYDALFKVTILMDIKDVGKLARLNVNFRDTVNRMLSTESIYWIYRAQQLFDQNRLEGLSHRNYMALCNLRQIMKNDFISGVNPYITKVPLAPVAITWFSKSKPKSEKYSFSKPYNKQTIDASLETLSTLILEDDAAELFKSSTRIASLTEQYNTDKKCWDFAKLQEDLYYRITSEDFNFIGLLPHIMSARATRCFTMFINVYCHLFGYIHIKPDTPESINLNTIMKMICLSQDDYFKVSFFEIFCSFNLKKIGRLVHLINIYYENNSMNAIQMALVIMPEPDKTAIKEIYRKNASMLPPVDIFPEDKQKNDLLNLQDKLTDNLNATLKLIKNTIIESKYDSHWLNALKVQLDEAYDVLVKNTQDLEKLQSSASSTLNPGV